MNLVVNQCQLCKSTMPSERADSWCETCFSEENRRAAETCESEFVDDGSVCDRCGGDGVVELIDTPELWGEDCFSEENRLVTCPSCQGRCS